MIYSGRKYISKTKIIELLDSKKDFLFFENKEAIIINYKNRNYRLFHIEDFYQIIKNNDLKINVNSDPSYHSLLVAINNKEDIQFKFLSSLRYCQFSNFNIVIDKQSLETIVLKNKQLKEHWESLKCFAIKNTLFFDTEILIELLLNNKLTISENDSDLMHKFQKLFTYHKLNKELINNKKNNLIKI